VELAARQARAAVARRAPAAADEYRKAALRENRIARHAFLVPAQSASRKSSNAERGLVSVSR
jgi:hypothetical protein